jgi:hypothetical protein
MRGRKLFFVEFLYRVDRFLILWGVINRKAVEAEVTSNLGADWYLLARKKILAVIKGCKSI